MLQFELRAVQDLAYADLVEIPGGLGVFRVRHVEFQTGMQRPSYHVHLESEDRRLQVLIVRTRGDQVRVVAKAEGGPIEDE